MRVFTALVIGTAPCAAASRASKAPALVHSEVRRLCDGAGCSRRSYASRSPGEQLDAELSAEQDERSRWAQRLNERRRDIKGKAREFLPKGKAVVLRWCGRPQTTYTGSPWRSDMFNFCLALQKFLTSPSLDLGELVGSTSTKVRQSLSSVKAGISSELNSVRLLALDALHAVSTKANVRLLLGQASAGKGAASITSRCVMPLPIPQSVIKILAKESVSGRGLVASVYDRTIRAAAASLHAATMR